MVSLRELKKSVKDVESKKKKKKKREGSEEGCRRESGYVGDAGTEMILGEDSVFAQAPKAKMPSSEDFEMEMDRAPGGSREGCRRESGRVTCVDDGGGDMIREGESAFEQAPKDFERGMVGEDLEREMDWASGGSGSINVDGIGCAGRVTSSRVILEETTAVHTENKRKASSSPEEKGGANKRKKVKIVTEVEGKMAKKDTEMESMVGTSERKLKRKRDNKKRKLKRRKRDNKRSLAETGVAPTVPEIAVVVTPHMPRRYGYLLKLVSFLLPYKTPGRAYECSLHKIQTLLRNSRCNLCIFFEWEPNDKRTFCWMFNTLTGTRIQFLVNPAFTCEILEVKVKRAACSFSSNFGDDDTWNAVKEMLEMMFCSAQHGQLEELDHLYIFTRIDDCVYFRNMEICKIPTVAGGDNDALVLKEVGPYFCLKLIDVHRESAVLCEASDVSPSQTTTEFSLCPTVCYHFSSCRGSCMFHSLCLNGQEFLIVLENGIDLSLFQGYNISLLEFLDEVPFLKKKKIVGSKDDEEHVFVRNIGKSIIRSIFAFLIELFSSGKCVKAATEFLDHRKILLKGSSVKLFGVEFVNYEEEIAKENVNQVVGLIIGCFPEGLVPCELMEMLERLQLLEDPKDPLEGLKLAKDDASLLIPKERRELMIHLHTEYMTNLRPLLNDDGTSEKCNSFFAECPYLGSWIGTMQKNKYLAAVANYNTDFVAMRCSKKTVEEGKEGQTGEFQFSIMRNCDVHIPENVGNDGITPFRLSWTDYMRTCYFPNYLSFIQRSMEPYKC